jgi:hypothetical protein
MKIENYAEEVVECFFMSSLLSSLMCYLNGNEVDDFAQGMRIFCKKKENYSNERQYLLQ